MKTISSVLIMLLFCAVSLGQSRISAQPDPLLYFSAGLSRPIFDNSGFEAWRQQNYHITKGDFGGNFDIGGIINNQNFGIHLSSAPDFNVAGIYYGRRLTDIHSKVSSFLNLEVGGFYINYDNLKPLGENVPPDNAGDKPELQYNTLYIGLSSRNYLNYYFHSLVGTGFYFDFGYEPLQKHWQYGYTKSDPNSGPNNADDDYSENSTFVGDNNVTSIPKLGNIFFDVGIFVTLGMLRTGK